MLLQQICCVKKKMLIRGVLLCVVKELHWKTCPPLIFILFISLFYGCMWNLCDVMYTFLVVAHGVGRQSHIAYVLSAKTTQLKLKGEIETRSLYKSPSFQCDKIGKISNALYLQKSPSFSPLEGSIKPVIS